MTELMLKFTGVGAEWVMWLLALLSFVSVTLMIERSIYFLTRRVDVDALGEKLSAALRTGDLAQAQRLVEGSRAIECVVIAAGLSAVHRGLHGVAETMHSAKARERIKLEAYLPILATLGNNAPFIGLLGTVIGIINASSALAAAQAAKQAGASAVMGSIFEALVATAVGLFVALPAVVAFNYFQRKARNSLLRTDVLAHLLISYMKPKADSPSPAPAMPPKIPQGV